MCICIRPAESLVCQTIPMGRRGADRDRVCVCVCVRVGKKKADAVIPKREEQGKYVTIGSTW